MLPDLHTDFSRGRSGGLVLQSLEEFSTVYCDPHSQRLWHRKISLRWYIFLQKFKMDLLKMNSLVQKPPLDLLCMIIHLLGTRFSGLRWKNMLFRLCLKNCDKKATYTFCLWNTWAELFCHSLFHKNFGAEVISLNLFGRMRLALV